jgi:hypothetical protein
MGSTRAGREFMRANKVYPIVREMHLSETDEACLLAADELVQILMRDEVQDTQTDPNNAPPQDDETKCLLEVVNLRIDELEGK